MNLIKSIYELLGIIVKWLMVVIKEMYNEELLPFVKLFLNNDRMKPIYEPIHNKSIHNKSIHNHKPIHNSPTFILYDGISPNGDPYNDYR